MKAQKGAALLVAMLTVALVATLTSAALWQQWRQVEIESAERGRSQTAWMMTGAMDWTRLILQEDVRAQQGGHVDHLGEPWALPVLESKLSTFLSQDQKWQEGDAEVFLSGYINDAQSRLNVRNLVDKGKIVAPELMVWVRLFERLNLPLNELESLTRRLPVALSSATANASESASTSPTATAASTSPSSSPLMPQRTAQLVWLGLSPQTLSVLDNFITVLPEPTPINLNTAPAEVLMACVPGLDLASARQLVFQRERGHWDSLDAARKSLGALGKGLDDQRHSIQSQYFEIHGRMRIDRVVQQERALVKREGTLVRMLWRARSPLVSPTAPLQ
jgi:general secretion pathway protein K